MGFFDDEPIFLDFDLTERERAILFDFVAGLSERNALTEAGVMSGLSLLERDVFVDGVMSEEEGIAGLSKRDVFVVGVIREEEDIAGLSERDVFVVGVISEGDCIDFAAGLIGVEVDFGIAFVLRE